MLSQAADRKRYADKGGTMPRIETLTAVRCGEFGGE